jgi:hypothetical protein
MYKRRATAFFSVLLATALFFPSALRAQDSGDDKELQPAPNIFIGPVVGKFMPSDAVFKQVYGNGGSILGFQVGWHFFRSDVFSLALCLDIRDFSQEGASTITGTASTITLKPLSFGLEAHLQRGVVGLWLGGGVVSVSYAEASALQDTSDSTTGFHIDGGMIFQLPSFPLAALKLYARWSKAVVTLADFEADVGGTEYGVSLLFRFKI